MIVSRNEIESLVLKAARGAGMSWGLAEEAAVAAGRLAEEGLPWAATLVGVVAQAGTTSPPRIAGNTIAPSRPGTRLCPIRTGALLSDLGPPASAMEVRNVLAPLWLAPFLTTWAGPDHGLRIAWGEVRLSVSTTGRLGAGGPADAVADAFADSVAIAVEGTGHAEPRKPRAGFPAYAVADDAWRRLEELEHRTYVPASAQSRLAGAGAGLLDND